MKFLREWISIKIALKPRAFILNVIIAINIALCLVGAIAVVLLTKNAKEQIGFWEAFYYSFSMIIDAGNIANIITNVTKTHLTLIILGIFIVLFGMVVFSGAIIGYIASYISSFIENASNGNKKVYLNDHIVILNWSTKVPEIINDLLYLKSKEKIVLLVENNKDKIMNEIEERLNSTIEREEKKGVILDRDFLTVIVREGSSYSTKDLDDISIKNAKAIIIFGKDECFNGEIEKDSLENKLNNQIKSKVFFGDAVTIKTLIQITKLVEDESGRKNIIVESKDSWTLEMASHIIEKEKKEEIENNESNESNNIHAISSNYILGQILAQFWLMPELNLVYEELLSCNGAEFYSKKISKDISEEEYIEDFLNNNLRCIPLTALNINNKKEMFFVAKNERDIDKKQKNLESEIEVDINYNYWIEPKNLLLIGSNSKTSSLFDTLDSFSKEWELKNENNLKSEKILDVMIIDHQTDFEKNKEIYDKPYISQKLGIDVYDTKKLYKNIKNFILKNKGNVSILILSDDSMKVEEQDAFSLTYLIYLKDIIKEIKEEDSNFKKENMDVVVEVSNPKNCEIIKNFNIKNLVISNSYISRIMTQLIKKESLYEFYKEIFEYDNLPDDRQKNNLEDTLYESKEIYIKKASRFFNKLPNESTVSQLIKGVYNNSPQDNKVILIGYINKKKEMTIFVNNHRKKIALKESDKLIVFSNH